MQYCRKGISSIASSPMSTRVKHAWEEQDKLVLGLAFIGGWFVKANINVLKRREDWYRVHRFIDDEKKRLEGKRARIEKALQFDEDKRRCCRSWETPWLSLAARGGCSVVIFHPGVRKLSRKFIDTASQRSLVVLDSCSVV
ncbi:PREDICTED: uncharacterized protein LOC106323407 isoform X2 [Brassica oleracea var. oleracea]|uniref:uncharacterized protein LOC106323407 isoform X2 n=1 Tax=Brassica oleracea var. oleracea TaxID=109376 RepID=UPI0006A70D82|nr:PREDICTED: uncharacterized protein LOC106323407 isoform X2 [Brassica oleracea var. oleracea]